MVKYVFLFCCFLVALIFIFRITVFFLSDHISQSKKNPSGDFSKRVFPTSFFLFMVLLLTTTSVTYYFFGRSDLIQTQFSQEELETNFLKLFAENQSDEYRMWITEDGDTIWE